MDEKERKAFNEMSRKKLTEACQLWNKYIESSKTDAVVAAQDFYHSLSFEHICAVFNAYSGSTRLFDRIIEAEEEISALLDIARADTLKQFDAIKSDCTRLEVPA